MLKREIVLGDREISLLCNYVSRLGKIAVDLLNDLGMLFQETLFMWHLANTRRYLRSSRVFSPSSVVSLIPSSFPKTYFPKKFEDTWNYRQTLRFAAGVAMISEGYRSWVSPQNLKRSLTAKVLYKCQTGILDDMIDKANYTYDEARRLYGLIIPSMVDVDFHAPDFKHSLRRIVKRNQLHLIDLISSITSGFNSLYSYSPRGRGLYGRMRLLDKQVTQGQALTIYQKEPHLDVSRLRKISSDFRAPADDLAWHEKLASYISGGTRYNLIDMSFSNREFNGRTLEDLLTAWYYYDAAIVFMNNAPAIEKDLKEDTANLSLIAMREKEVESLDSLRGYKPELTQEEYEAHTKRIAEVALRGFEIARKTLEDREHYYPFITAMMPVVMMTDEGDLSGELTKLFLERIVPTTEEAFQGAPQEKRKRVGLSLTRG